MDYASRDAEEAAVAARGIALNAAGNIGNDNFRDKHGRGANHSAYKYAEEAQTARALANEQAGKAASIYDQVKDL